jgi:membrane protein
MRKWLRILVRCKQFGRRWIRHRHTDNAAALTFFALISLPPLLLFGVILAGIILGEGAAHGELERRFSEVLGPEVARTIEGVLQGARIAPRSEPLAFLVAMGTLLYAGSHVLSKLRTTLNLVNEAAPKEFARPWLGRLASRGLAAGLILLFGVLLAAGTLMDAVTAYLASQVESPWMNELGLFRRLGWISTYLLMTAGFALMMKILPRRRPLWRHAWIGAGLAALVVVFLKGALDLYIQHSMWGSIIGGGLNFLLSLFWLFLSIQAFLGGAEVAAWLSQGKGRGIR